MVKNLPTIDRSQKVRVGGGVFGDQTPESIILNATRESISGPLSGLYVAPIRENSGALLANTLVYNTNTREVQYQVSQFNLQEVTEYGAATDQAVTVANALTSNDLTVYGNLLVQGKTTYLNVENKRIADPIIEIASNNAVAEHEFDAGIIVTRPGGSNVAVVYDESADELGFMYTPNVASDRFITAESPQTVNHVVTFNGSAFVVDGTAQPALTFRRGDTHVFDVSADSMIDNRLRFSETIDGSEYTAGVSTNGIISGRPSATVTLAVSHDAPTTLYYVNLDASGAGAAIDLSDTHIAGILAVNVHGDVTSNCYFGEGQWLANVTRLSHFEDNVSRISVLESDLASNNARVGALESSLASNNVRVSTLETYASSNAVRVGLLETRLVDNSNRLSELSGYHASNVTRVENLEGSLADNALRVTNLESNLQANSLRISTLSTRLVDNSFRISVNTTDLADNAHRVENLETNLVANSQRTSALETYAASNTSRIQTLEANVALTGPYLTQNSERVSVLESLVPTKAPIHNPVFTGIASGNASGMTGIGFDYVSNLSNETSNTVQFKHSDVAFVTDERVGVKVAQPSADHALHVDGNVFTTANVVCDRLIATGTRLDGVENLLTGNVRVTGNLNVLGNVTNISARNIFIQDPILGIGNPDAVDSGVIVSTTETLGNVAFGYNLSDKEYVIAYTQDGPDGLTLTPDGSKDLNVHVYGTLYSANAFGVANTNPVSSEYALSIGTNVYARHDGDLLSIRSLADTGIFSSNVTTPEIVSTGDYVTLAAPTTIVGGNLEVRGQTTFVSTSDITIDDAMVEMANTNTLSSVDLGFRMKRPGANVLAAYKGVAEEFVFAHATTGETPDASKQMNVHVYGALFADESINVNSNCFINYDGIVTANAYKGDGGLLSNVRSTFQSITENGPWPAGAATDLKVTFANVSTGLEVTEGNVVVANVIYARDFVGAGGSNVGGVAWASHLVDNASRVSTLETGLDSNAALLTSTITELDSNASRVSTLEAELDSNAALLTATVTELDSNAALLTSTITELDSNAALLTQTIAELDSNAALLTATITELDSNAALLTSTITELDSNASRVSTLEAGLSSNSALLTQTIGELDSNAARVGVLEANVALIGPYLTDNSSRVTALETTKAPLFDPTFTSNIEVSGNAHIQGNLTVGGQLTYLSTDNTILKDAIVQLANTNTASTLDMGFVLTRPASNIGFGWRGDEEEFFIGHSTSDASGSDLAPLAGSSLHVHTYGTHTVDGDFQVGETANLFVDVSSARVGINSASPSVALDVVGDATLTRSDDGSSAGPVLTLHRVSATAANGDYMGQLKFTGKNDQGATKVYSKITAKTSDVTGGTEDGLFEFAVHKAGSMDPVARLTSSDLKLINNTGLEVAGESDLTGRLAVAYDTDTPSFFGRAAVGHATGSSSDHAAFAHLDNNTGTNYAIKQSAAGATFINAKSGSRVAFSVANSEKMRLTSAGKLGINETNPQYELDVGGEINATLYRGDGGLLSNIASNLEQISNNGNVVTSNTLQFMNAQTAFVTDSGADVGVKLDQMSEITIGSKASNDVLLWNGSAWVNSGILGSTYAPLLDPTFTSNVEINRGLVINKERVAQKHYSYSGTLTSFSNVGIQFDSNVFYSRITAQLVHEYDDVNTMVLEVSGGKKPGGGTLQNIAIGTNNKWGGTNAYPWTSNVVTTTNSVILKPHQSANSGNYEYDLYIEYHSSAAGGACSNIKHGETVVENFYY